MNQDIRNIVEETQSTWGGLWTERKLEAFSKYVISYLTIMRKYPFFKTIYFDGFAGSGTRKTTLKTELFNQLNILEYEEKVYKGAAERVLNLPNELSFDYHYFIDTNDESLRKLKNKLSAFQVKKKTPFQFRSGDCNQNLDSLSLALNSGKYKYAALVLLDPFGMQINWKSIAKLKNTRTDIWILVPTGVIVNRLLDKNGVLKHTVKLQSFFGLPEEDVKRYFYETKIENTLFGETEIVKKVNDPIEKIAELYIERLKTTWKHVTEKPLVLKNSNNVPIFHFVFASNNPNALKIANQIIKTI